jgi:hypothetical protein
MANRKLPSITMFALLLAVALGGCKKAPLAPPAPPEPSPTPLSTACGTENARMTLVHLANEEYRISKIDAASKKAPSKENFRKVFEAQKSLKEQADATLKAWTECKDVSVDARGDLKRSIKGLETALKYWRDNFPDFR